MLCVGLDKVGQTILYVEFWLKNRLGQIQFILVFLPSIL